MLRFVSLLVRLWVEICNLTTIIWNIICQPPCEAVSWNVIASFLTASKEGQPPCEAVSWNEVQVQSGLYCHGQPPCEAVSWNSFSMASFTSLDVSLLVRLWVEIMSISWDPEPKNVSLLVRLWVEMFSMGIVLLLRLLSASLWGCELKWQSHCLRLFQHAVSLLVRLWVEISRLMKFSRMLVVSLLVRLWVEISM